MIKKCVPGCRHYEGGEVKHHKDCDFYPDSLSRTIDDQEEIINKLKGDNKMTLDEQLKGRFTEEEAEHIISEWWRHDNYSIHDFIEMCKEKVWIKKKELEKAKEEYHRYARVLHNQAERVPEPFQKYIDELEKEVERLRKEK